MKPIMTVTVLENISPFDPGWVWWAKVGAVHVCNDSSTYSRRSTALRGFRRAMAALGMDLSKFDVVMEGGGE